MAPEGKTESTTDKLGKKLGITLLNVTEETGEPVRRKAERVLAEPKSKESKFYALLVPAIQARLRTGRFTHLQAAAVAKKLGGSEEMIRLFLQPTLPIEQATQFLIQLIKRQQAELLQSLPILEKVAGIISDRFSEEQLRSYLKISAVPPQATVAEAPAASIPVRRPVIVHQIPKLEKGEKPKKKENQKKLKVSETLKIPLVEYIRILELGLHILARRNKLALSHLIIIGKLFGVDAVDAGTLDPDLAIAINKTLTAIRKIKVKKVAPHIKEYVDCILGIPVTHPFISQLTAENNPEELHERALILGSVASIQKDMLSMLEEATLGTAHVLGVCKLLHISTERSEILRDTRGFLENLHVHVPLDDRIFTFGFDIQSYHNLKNLLSIDKDEPFLSQFTEETSTDHEDITEEEANASAVLQAIETTRQVAKIKEVTLRTVATRLRKITEQPGKRNPEDTKVLKNLLSQITAQRAVIKSLPSAGEGISRLGTPLSGALLEHRIKRERGEITHSFQLTLREEEAEISMFTQAGDVILEGLQAYIQDVLFFGHGLLTKKEAQYLLEPLAQAFGEKCKFGIWESLMHEIRLKIRHAREHGTV